MSSSVISANGEAGPADSDLFCKASTIWASSSEPFLTLNRTSPVTITVTDLMGREVAMLLSETQAPGSYTVTWEARNQPSGVYLYRLQTDRFTQTRKMILLR